MTQREITRARSQKMNTENTQRRSETRTKIQLGGLLLKAGLVDQFDIELGSDLQQDFDAREQATLLLGALIDLSKQLENDPHLKHNWAILGRSAMIDQFLAQKEFV